MVNYSIEERNFMVTEYIRTQSYQSVQATFSVRYPGRNLVLHKISCLYNPSPRRKITEQFDDILKANPNFVRNPVHAMRSRARLCLQRNGGHVKGVEY